MKKDNQENDELKMYKENLKKKKFLVGYQFNNYNRSMFNIGILVFIPLGFLVLYLTPADEFSVKCFQLGASFFPYIVMLILVNRYPSLVFFPDSINVFWFCYIDPRYTTISYQSIEKIIKHPKRNTYYLITRLTDNNLKFFALNLWFFPQKKRQAILTLLQLHVNVMPEINYEYRKLKRFNFFKDRAAHVAAFNRSYN